MTSGDFNVFNNIINNHLIKDLALVVDRFVKDCANYRKLIFFKTQKKFALKFDEIFSQNFLKYSKFANIHHQNSSLIKRS
jgi:hypothetical protein